MVCEDRHPTLWSRVVMPNVDGVIERHFKNLTPRRFFRNVRQWCPDFINHMNWQDYSDQHGSVYDWVPDEKRKQGNDHDAR